MRPIDADALIPMMKYATTDSEIGEFPIKIGFDAIVKVIDAQPTILEATEAWNRRAGREVTDNFKNREESALKTEDKTVSEKDVIYRQAAIEAIEDVDWYHQNRNGEMVHGANPDEHQAWYKIQDVYEALDGVPSAQQEIIRCKDCKHYKFSGNRAFEFPVTICDWTGFEDVDDDDFCSRAERRR